MLVNNLFDDWSKKYKKSIDCDNPKGFSQKAHCAGRRARQAGKKTKSTSVSESCVYNISLVDAIRDFLPLALSHLDINHSPSVKLKKKIELNDQPTFGRYNNQTGIIYLGIHGRHPVDILRTLAHELVHYKQGCNNELDDCSGKTGSPAENEANAVAGIIMRNFNKKFPQYLKLEPVVLP